jgi:hypothetical protein
MLKSEVLRPRKRPGLVMSFFDWTIYMMTNWMIKNAGTNPPSKTLQEIKIPPWAKKAHKTGLPKQFKVKSR